MSEAAAALSGVETAAPESDNGAIAQSANAPSWMDGFSEDTLAYVQNKGWDSPKSLLESYRNLEKFSGGSKNIVELPGVDADETTLANFYDRLGRPGSPDQYGFNVPEGADPELVNWFGETAHRHGLSAKQAQSLFNEWNEMSNSRLENMQHEMKVANEQQLQDLKREWGSDYDSNLDAGRRAVAALGYDEQSLSSLEEKMGTGEMMKLFAQIGARMGEDSFITGNESGNGFGSSPAQAQMQINELKSDQQFMKAYMEGDKAAVAKMQRLMSQAYG
jgi:hypothetical protein